MKLKSYLSLLLCVFMCGCGFTSTPTPPTHFTPTAPPILTNGVQHINHNGYKVSYIAHENDLQFALALLDQPSENVIASWNEALANIELDMPTKVDPLLFNTLNLIQTIASANDTLTLFDDVSSLLLDPSQQTISLSKPYQLTLSSNINHAIQLAQIKAKLSTTNMYQLAIDDASYFHAFIPASYNYYSYPISTDVNGLTLQFNNAYSIATVAVNSDTIAQLTLVGENPIAIELVKDIIPTLTYDQLKIILKALDSIAPIYLIVTLPLDTHLAIDIKFKNSVYAYTWDKALDQYIIPNTQ